MSHAERLPIAVLLASWERAMRARNVAPKTIGRYLDSARQLTEFADAKGLDPLGRQAIEEYLADQAARLMPSTVSFRYRALQQWFKWLVEEEEEEEEEEAELGGDPWARMKPPIVPEHPVPVLTRDQMRALLQACQGTGFVERRDTAIVRLFIDTGMRLGELAGLDMDDVDLDLDVAIITGKGRRMRSAPFGVKAAQALDRYMRARTRNRRGRDACAVAGREVERPPDVERDRADASPTRSPGRHRRAASASVPPHLRQRLAAGRWDRGRPDAARRLAIAADAEPLRGVRGGPARPRRAPSPRTRRPTVGTGAPHRCPRSQGGLARSNALSCASAASGARGRGMNGPVFRDSSRLPNHG